MGLQIVTGYTGTAHIKSAHDRARNAGTVGTGSYVMKTGNMLAAKMQSANTLRIVDGDLMMQGVHATVEAGTHEDLTVDNGTQGKKRNDLVVARYERLAGEPKTESVTLRVIKGVPSDGAAADPAHTEGDILGGDLVAEMPLYRVPIDGITPGEPVALFETVPTIAELGDSVSQATVFSGTRVITFSSERHALFEIDEQIELFGRRIDANRDFVGVMNGDGTVSEANPRVHMLNGRAIVVLDRGLYAALRINSVVVLRR